eukprot:747857-Hanusia_phi.AAC.3
MTDKKEGLDDMGLEGSAFEALERDFQEVLQDLVGDKSLERFKVEYEKLHRALKKSHDSEKRLIKKCRELNQEIVANAAKVQTALKLSQEDQNTIASLKKEIEKAWKMVDASHEKEQRAKETIQQLKLEITNLSRLVEQGAGLTLGQENTVNELTKQKDELTAERDNLTQQLVTARNEIVDLQDKCRNLDTEKQAYEADIMTLKEQINKSKSDVEREVRKKERLEKEIKEIKSSLEKKGEEVKAKQEAIAKGQEELQRLDTKIKEFEQTVQKAHKENDLLTQKTQKLQQDLEEQISTNTQLLAENAHRQIEIKSKEDEINRLRSAATKESRLKDGLLKKIKEVEQKKHDVEVQKEELKGQISKLVKESEVQQKQIEYLAHPPTPRQPSPRLLHSSTRCSCPLTPALLPRCASCTLHFALTDSGAHREDADGDAEAGRPGEGAREYQEEPRGRDRGLQVGGSEAEKDHLLAGEGAGEVRSAGIRCYRQVPRGAGGSQNPADDHHRPAENDPGGRAEAEAAAGAVRGRAVGQEPVLEELDRSPGRDR